MTETHGAGVPPAGWYPDPTGQHEQRYWDGRAWTSAASDAGMMVVEPGEPGEPVEPVGGGELDEILERWRPAFADGPVFMRPDIPEPRLANALSRYARGVDPGDVLVLADTTLRGNGKAGCVITATHVYAHELALTRHLALSEIHEVEVAGNFVKVDGQPLLSAAMADEPAEELVSLLRELAAHRSGSAGGARVGLTWTTGAPPIALGQGKTGIGTGGRTHFSPGDEVPFVLHLDPWPDDKISRIEVELCFEHTHLAIAHVDPAAGAHTAVGILFAASPHWEAIEVGDKDGKPMVTVVATAVLSPDAIGADGVVSSALSLPEECPPSMPGVVEWRVRAQVVRRHGLAHSGAVEIDVAAPPSGEQPDGGRPAAASSGEWIVQAWSSDGSWNDRVAHMSRPREVDVVVDSPRVIAGGEVSGSVAMIVDPARRYLETTHAMTSRGRAQIEEADAQVPRSLEVERVTVALECWRGSEERMTLHRAAEVEEQIAGHLTVPAGTEWRVPFRIEVPEGIRLHLRTVAAGATDPGSPLIPTFSGDRFFGIDLDDIRWRVVAKVFARPDQFRSLPGHHSGDLGYSADDAASPLWAAAEVVVSH